MAAPRVAAKPARKAPARRAAKVEPTSPAPQRQASEAVAEQILKKRRTFSIKGLADFLQVDRSVIDRDINKNGFVPDRLGGKGSGNEYEIDIAKYHEWKLEHVRRTTMAERGGQDDGDADAYTKLLKLFKEGSPWLHRLRVATGLRVNSKKGMALRDGDLFHWSDSRLSLLAERLGVGLQLQVAA